MLQTGMRVNWLLFRLFSLISAYFGFFQLILAYLELMVLIFTVVLISTQKLTWNKNHRFFWELLVLFKNLRVYSLRTMVLIKNECIFWGKNLFVRCQWDFFFNCSSPQSSWYFSKHVFFTYISITMPPTYIWKTL